ncbi:hypothetical protein FRC04_011351 [Tulasnella sp. 424]|nr:hypothetical protein FRC04_011351 [Tulasnella sp. 424]KAG8975480.1 hypothetical protein FRC05_005549 [Tulasnella sp. 425]
MASHNATSATDNQSLTPGPTYYLPVELLTFILTLRFPDTDDVHRTIHRTREDMTELYNLRLVSKSWKELIEDTPTLWTHILIDFPTTVIRDCLRWSKCHPLRIRGFYRWNDSSDTLIKHLELLQPHSRRWRTLAYSSSVGPLIDYQHIKDFLESPAPMLKSIYTYLDAFQPVRTVNLAGGQATTLKHLSLYDALLPWSSNLLHGLETFSLWIQTTIPAEEIINLFTKSPALKTLELSCQGAEGPDNPIPLTTSPLDTAAASLEEVIIHVTSPHITSHILSRVSMPSCESLELSANFTTPGDLYLLGNSLAQFMPRIAEVLKMGGRTNFLVSSEFEYEWSSPLEYEAFQFSFGINGLSVDSVIGWIRNLVAGLESQLELEAILDTFDRQTAEALAEWNDITKVRVLCEKESSTYETDEDMSLLEFLGDVRTDPVNGLSWPFPNLQDLDIYHAGCDHLAVFGMLNKRYLPDTYISVLEGEGISVRTPPQVNLRVNSTEGDATTNTVLKHHWGVKSLNLGELGG